MLGVFVGAAAVIAGLVLNGCAHVCPSGWEAGTSVGHSALFGQTYEASVSVSGDIGKECRDNSK